MSKNIGHLLDELQDAWEEWRDYDAHKISQVGDERWGQKKEAARQRYKKARKEVLEAFKK